MTPEPQPNYEAMSDAALAPLYQRGVSEVLPVLYRRYKDRFRRRALAILQKSKQSTAEDLLQDHYLVLQVRHAQYDPERASDPGNPWFPWANRLLHNAGCDLLRREAPGSRGGEVSRQSTEEPHSREPGPVEQAAAGELAEAIIDALQELAEEQRAALVLLQQGHTHREIANNLEVPISTVYTLIYKARQRLLGRLHARGHREINP